MEDERDWGPKPFRFYNFWFSNPSCVNIMKQAWEGTQVQGFAAFRIIQKLKSMKESLKTWSKEEFGNLQLNLRNAEEQLHSLDIQAENGTIRASDLSKRRELKAEV